MKFARAEKLLIETADVTAKADTVEALAAKSRVAPEALAATVARYNHSVDSGDDPEFDRLTYGIPEPTPINDRMLMPPSTSGELACRLIPADPWRT